MTDNANLPTTAFLTADASPRLVVDTRRCRGEVGLYGATVTSFVPAGGRELLFVSKKAVHDGSRPVRGGIPVCFPWFGVGFMDERMEPLHGFARKLPWELVEVVDDDAVVTSRFRLTGRLAQDAPGRHLVPQAFTAELEVRMGQTLRLELAVTNTDSEPLTYEVAFHTYFSVLDVTACRLHGLEGVEYVQDGVAGVGSRYPLRVDGHIDRVYDSATQLTLDDPDFGRRITITGENSSHAIVWNPGPQGAAEMTDMADHEWVQMLCVETARARDAAVMVAPGATARVAVELAVSELPVGR